MLQGEYSSKMDEKGRVSIPIKLRKDLGVEFVVTKGIDDCLALYPEDAWEIYKAKINANNKSNPAVRKLIRIVIGKSLTVAPDKQGRINVGPSLREIAGLTKEVVFVGMSDYVEIWDKATYDGEQDVDLAQLLAETNIEL